MIFFLPGPIEDVPTAPSALHPGGGAPHPARHPQHPLHPRPHRQALGPVGAGGLQVSSPHGYYLQGIPANHLMDQARCVQEDSKDILLNTIQS